MIRNAMTVDKIGLPVFMISIAGCFSHEGCFGEGLVDVHLAESE